MDGWRMEVEWKLYVILDMLVPSKGGNGVVVWKMDEMYGGAVGGPGQD